MKKISSFITAIIFMFFAFGSGSADANADLLSEVVKKDANQFCGTLTFSVDEQISQNTVQEGAMQEELIQDEKFEIDTNAAKAGAFVNKTATSKSGSTIILPAVSGVKYGYCHIYNDHMKRANGKLNYKIGTKSQFQYAYYPDKAMAIALEVINLQNTLISEGDGRYRKEIYSPLAGMKIRVSFNLTSNFDGGKYTKYKFVIVSMYPI